MVMNTLFRPYLLATQPINPISQIGLKTLLRMYRLCLRIHQLTQLMHRIHPLLTILGHHECLSYHQSLLRIYPLILQHHLNQSQQYRRTQLWHGAIWVLTLVVILLIHCSRIFTV